MKKLIIIFLGVGISLPGFSQWVTLNSTTTVNLRDVDFITPDDGVIVGNGGVILHTSDGGLAWTDINNNQVPGDVQHVSMLNADTIFVSTYSTVNFDGAVYKTENGGVTWSQVATDNTSNHSIDLGTSDGISIYRLGSMLEESSNNGSTWNTLLQGTGGTTSLFSLKFSDAMTGHASGNISGFVGYSSYFYRTANGGANWYANDLFSYLNSDALTAMCFVNSDTVILFMNDYNGFMPSNINKVVLTTDYQISTLVSGDTVFSFTSQILNAAMPTYVNDGAYTSSSTGYAFGEDGTVYKTINGGAAWVADYPAGAPLVACSFVNGTGYGVGNNGKLIKLVTVSGAVDNIGDAGIRLFPTITNQVIYFQNNLVDRCNYEVYSQDGKLITEGSFTGKDQFDVTHLAKGVYMVKFSTESVTEFRRFVVP